MLALGTPAPAFELPDPAGKVHRNADFVNADGLLVAFICNHCPYVKHIRTELAALGKDCQARGVAMVAINSNAEVAADSPARMAEEAEAWGYTFPYLFDETQDVARAYRAACTPEFYLFDAERKLVYRGQLDDSRPGNGKPVTGKDLRAAIDALLAGAPVAPEQVASVGCNIKWRRGQAPDYA